MSTYKTRVEAATLDAFFAEHPAVNPKTIETIADGEGSQAFFFEEQHVAKVLRINKHHDEGFRKDILAYERFRNDSVPIPKIEEVGELPGGAFFAVSVRSEGKTLDKLSNDETKTVMFEVIRTMDAIHQIPPIGEGYGFIQLDGSGKYDSWHEALDADQKDEEDAEALANSSFFEQDIYNRLRAKIKHYYQFIPNDIRQLIHRDYGFNNTLSDGQKVTGVIDWHDAQYGDPMYDVAWLDFWAPWQHWEPAIRQYYQEQDRMANYFDERLACYKLIIGANSMSFFAKSEQEEKYKWARDKVLKLELSPTA